MSIPMSHSQPLAPFNPDEDPSVNGPGWEKLLKRFNNYLVAANITDDGRKKALLLWLSGESVHEIYDTLADDTDMYTNACEKLSTYFHPMKDQHVAVYHFREASQGSDSID